MSGAREAIEAALFARLCTVTAINTSSRRLKHWADVPPSDQPSLYLVRKGETIEPVPGLPPRRRLMFDIVLYAQGTVDVPPSAVLNPLIDAVEAALAPGNPTVTAQTLGGLVAETRLDGKVDTDGGVLGDQAVAILPVVVLWP